MLIVRLDLRSGRNSVLVSNTVASGENGSSDVAVFGEPSTGSLYPLAA